MCIEDKKLGMKSTNRFWLSTGSVIIPADPRRIAISITASAGETAHLNILNQTVIGVAGLQTINILSAVNPNNSTEIARIEDFGQCLQGSMELESVGGASVFATETLLIDNNLVRD